MSDAPPDNPLDRYSRQMLFEPIGEAGQRRLLDSRVTLIGCGALGTVLANTLARAGVGFLRIADRDFIEMNNLQRQVLFDEQDIAEGLPKAEAACRKLAAANSSISVEPHVTDVNPGNIESLCDGAHLILDGTDNFETRFLINDVAVKLDIPWIYGACVAGEGLVMPILPHETPCLRCIWEDAPPAGMSPTCDTVGVLSPVVNIVASFQAVHALKILTGNADDLNRDLLTIDGWGCRVRGMNMQPARDAGDCPCCRQGKYEFLEGELGSKTTTLCGRDAVQILPPAAARASAAAGGYLAQLAARLEAGMELTCNRYMLKFRVDSHEVTVFADGRAIIKGTNDPAVARSVYSRYVGL